MGVSKNTGPQNRPQYTMILVMRTPKRAPNFWKNPYDHCHVIAALEAQEWFLKNPSTSLDLGARTSPSNPRPVDLDTAGSLNNYQHIVVPCHRGAFRFTKIILEESDTMAIFWFQVLKMAVVSSTAKGCSKNQLAASL